MMTFAELPFMVTGASSHQQTKSLPRLKSSKISNLGTKLNFQLEIAWVETYSLCTLNQCWS